MFFSNINPLTLAVNLGKPLVAAGVSKVRERLSEAATQVKEHMTARNTAYAALAAGAVGAALINPTSRIALCTFLSVSYTLSTITFNLIMFGLYMAWTGMQGASVLGSAGITLTSLLGGFGKGLLGGLGKAVPEAAPVEAYVPDALNGALDEALNLFDASENVAAPIGQRMLDGVAEASSSAITNAQALEEIFANQAAVGPEVGTAVALGELAATQGTMSALNDMFELQASEGFEEAMVPLAVLKDGIDVAPKSNKFPLKKAALVLGGTAAAGLAAYGIYKMLKKRQANKTEAPEAPTSYTVIDRNDLEANGCGML